MVHRCGVYSSACLRARALDGDLSADFRGLRTSLPRLSGPVLECLCAPTTKSRLADPSLSRRCKSWILDHTLRAEEAATVDRASGQMASGQAGGGMPRWACGISLRGSAHRPASQEFSPVTATATSHKLQQKRDKLYKINVNF